MAIMTWHAVAKVDCGRAEPAELLEARLYPADFLRSGAAAYQVRERACTQAQDCRAAGRPCHWTGFNPNYDPFAR